ncbi:MAG: hypothetical protein PHU82_01885 [Candidatus Pacebacteria bacterium]|jgi:hypothetical protein|nr:hypothetical protein [Candidatus Paceibacterota bacterium]MDD4994499.1 hypothetical protein [Candidatus Paceibacterota bacterium]
MKAKYLIILFIVLLIGLSFLAFIWYFNPEIRQAKLYKQETEVLEGRLQEEQERYINDIYGGQTPEETYKMFLEALGNKDIELAIKYFIFDRQELYKQFFLEIKNNNKWEEMMKDLFKYENQIGEMKPNGSYIIRVYSEDNFLIAQVVLRVPLFLENEQQNISNIWKIVEF